MSNKENEVKQTQENNEPQEAPRGFRGELGKPTASLTIKQQWHEATHLLVDVGDNNNPRRQAWVRKAGTPSLKKFARQLLASGNQLAKDWFAHKSGSLNEERNEKNRSRASLEAQASKAARRKKSQGKNKPAATTT